MLEEILLRLGLDASTMASGLRSAKDSVRHTAHEMRDSFNEAFEHFGSLFSAGAMIAGFEKLISYVHETRVEADNLGVSFEFLQGFKHTLDSIGPGAEKGVKGLSVLNRTLGEARDGSVEAIKKFEKLGISVSDIASMNTDAMFYRVADAIHGTEDATLRSARAFDVMGKAGGAMVSILAEGGDKLREHIEAARKIAEADAKQIEQVRQTLHEAESNVSVAASKIIGLWGSMWQTLGELSTAGSQGQGGYWKLIREQSIEASEEMTRRIHAEVDSQMSAEEKITAAKLAEGKKREEEAEKQTKDILKTEKEIELFSKGFEPGSQEFLAAKADAAKELVAELERTVSLTQDEEERNKQLVDLSHAKLDLVKSESDLKKKQFEDQKKADDDAKRDTRERRNLTKEIAQTEGDIAMAKLKQKESRLAPYRPSLEELAESKGPFRNTAQQIINNQKLAKQKLISGDSQGAEALINQNEGYDRQVQVQSTNPMDYFLHKTTTQHVPGLMDSLRGSKGQGPLGPDMAAIETEKHMRELNQKLFEKKEAIKVIPTGMTK